MDLRKNPHSLQVDSLDPHPFALCYVVQWSFQYDGHLVTSTTVLEDILCVVEINGNGLFDCEIEP